MLIIYGRTECWLSRKGFNEQIKDYHSRLMADICENNTFPYTSDVSVKFL